jgi:hypothetical protein
LVAVLVTEYLTVGNNQVSVFNFETIDDGKYRWLVIRPEFEPKSLPDIGQYG